MVPLMKTPLKKPNLHRSLLRSQYAGFGSGDRHGLQVEDIGRYQYVTATRVAHSRAGFCACRCTKGCQQACWHQPPVWILSFTRYLDKSISAAAARGRARSQIVRSM